LLPVTIRALRGRRFACGSVPLGKSTGFNTLAPLAWCIDVSPAARRFVYNHPRRKRMIADVRSVLIRVRLLVVVAGLSSLLFADDPIKPPVAAKKPRQVTLHGETLPDDYFWLRAK